MLRPVPPVLLATSVAVLGLWTIGGVDRVDTAEDPGRSGREHLVWVEPLPEQ